MSFPFLPPNINFIVTRLQWIQDSWSCFMASGFPVNPLKITITMQYCLPVILWLYALVYPPPFAHIAPLRELWVFPSASGCSTSHLLPTNYPTFLSCYILFIRVCSFASTITSSFLTSKYCVFIVRLACTIPAWTKKSVKVGTVSAEPWAACVISLDSSLSWCPYVFFFLHFGPEFTLNNLLQGGSIPKWANKIQQTIYPRVTYYTF